ncbi:MAG: PTS fructose transporter subunit IIA [Candidatus Neomarinimicrobiota bacterium]|nr:PTS sugar transporter subunit IIA [Candidatus Neomarinimicrobiota bacterium]RKY50148.1 MAG: PTS fructose transporter subunit IIA [Candidatus Neomarinimicrobiota bacterium]
MDEIMTLEEVAKYLKVSERTVINWVNKGELPGGKIGTSWRFKRADIEKWVNRKLGSGSIDSREEFFISRLLVPERVVILDCKTKNEALDSLIEVMSRVSGISSFEKLREAVFKREKIMSTGIGFGIAVPHVRIEGVNGVYMAFGVSKKGIPDYESLDGKPVHIVVLMVAGVGQHVQYLKALSRISRILRDKKTMESLIAAKDEQEIYNILVSKDKEV